VVFDLMVAVALSFAAAGPATEASPFTPLTLRLPAEVPGPEVLARWELIQGRNEGAGLHATYRFYIDPARPALYTVTQYRVPSETEKVLWNAGPRGRSLECYELLPEGWRRLEPTSERYRLEMGTAIRIYHMHNARTERPEP
jgi:hypothetical protein